jgi:hypothetical protein
LLTGRILGVYGEHCTWDDNGPSDESPIDVNAMLDDLDGTQELPQKQRPIEVVVGRTGACLLCWDLPTQLNHLLIFRLPRFRIRQRPRRRSKPQVHQVWAQQYSPCYPGSMEPLPRFHLLPT